MDNADKRKVRGRGGGASATSRTNVYRGTSNHEVRTQLRAQRAENAERNFASGHWQHRTPDGA